MVARERIRQERYFNASFQVGSKTGDGNEQELKTSPMAISQVESN